MPEGSLSTTRLFSVKSTAAFWHRRTLLGTAATLKGKITPQEHRHVNPRHWTPYRRHLPTVKRWNGKPARYPAPAQLGTGQPGHSNFVSLRATSGMGVAHTFYGMDEFVNTESTNNDNGLCLRRASSVPKEASPQELAYLGAKWRPPSMTPASLPFSPAETATGPVTGTALDHLDDKGRSYKRMWLNFGPTGEDVEALTHAPSKECAYRLKQTLHQCLIDWRQRPICRPVSIAQETLLIIKDSFP